MYVHILNNNHPVLGIVLLLFLLNSAKPISRKNSLIFKGKHLSSSLHNLKFFGFKLIRIFVVQRNYLPSFLLFKI